MWFRVSLVGLWWERSSDRSWLKETRRTNNGLVAPEGPKGFISQGEALPLIRQKSTFSPLNFFSAFLSFSGVLMDWEAYWNNECVELPVCGGPRLKAGSLHCVQGYGSIMYVPPVLQWEDWGLLRRNTLWSTLKYLENYGMDSHIMSPPGLIIITL